MLILNEPISHIYGNAAFSGGVCRSDPVKLRRLQNRSGLTEYRSLDRRELTLGPGIARVLRLRPSRPTL